MIAPHVGKKLIEVALPLDAINKAAAREKSIRHGHPSTLHLWWARRPLAAARAVILAQMVDDPSEYADGKHSAWGGLEPEYDSEPVFEQITTRPDSCDTEIQALLILQANGVFDPSRSAS